MNIWKTMTDKELEAANNLVYLLESLSKESGKGYKSYFKVVPTSVGQIVYFCCDELDIHKDITDYNSF